MIREKPNSYKAEFRESLVNVSRSAYYDWLDRSPKATEKEDRTLTEMIVKAFTKSRATYGTRRLKRELFNQDRITSQRRIGRLMREAELACKTRRKFKATTHSRHDFPIAENRLDREFKVNNPK